MAIEGTNYANVERIERTSRITLASDLHLKGVGFATTDTVYPNSLWFKRSNGTAYGFSSIGSNAEYSTLNLSSLPGSGSILSIDVSGNVMKTSISVAPGDPYSGWAIERNVTMSFDNSTRTLTLTHIGTANYKIQGDDRSFTVFYS